MRRIAYELVAELSMHRGLHSVNVQAQRSSKTVEMSQRIMFAKFGRSSVGDRHYRKRVEGCIR